MTYRMGMKKGHHRNTESADFDILSSEYFFDTLFSRIRLCPIFRFGQKNAWPELRIAPLRPPRFRILCGLHARSNRGEALYDDQRCKSAGRAPAKKDEQAGLPAGS